MILILFFYMTVHTQKEDFVKEESVTKVVVVSPTYTPTPTIINLSPKELLLKQLETKGIQYKLPKTVWYPIMMTECEGNSILIYTTSDEKSYGIFQVNIVAHPEADVSRLLDVDYNCDWQMPKLKKWHEKGKLKGLVGMGLTKYVARYGQAPEWSQYYIKSIEKYYKEVLEEEDYD